MGKLRQVPLEDLVPMGDEEAKRGGVEVRVAVAADGKRSAVIVPRAFARLSEEGMEIVAVLQQKALLLHEIGRDIEGLVIESRMAGASWDVIGWSIGTSGQAARKRWADLG